MNQQLEETINSFMNAIQIKPSGIMIWISLAVALLFAAILWVTYRLSNTKQSYQPKFAATLVALAIISTNEYCTFSWNDRFVIDCKISYEYS